MFFKDKRNQTITLLRTPEKYKTDEFNLKDDFAVRLHTCETSRILPLDKKNFENYLITTFFQSSISSTGTDPDQFPMFLYGK